MPVAAATWAGMLIVRSGSRTATAHAAFLAFQNSFLLAQEGSLDEDIFGAITAALLPTKDLPGMRRYWRQRRGYFFPEFAEYIDDLFTGEESSDAVDVYRDAAAAQQIPEE